jgi:uncharacterized lipoprotein (TIGR02269 family)
MKKDFVCRLLFIWVAIVLLLSGCAASSVVVEEWEKTAAGETAECSSPNTDQCIVFACEEGECGVFGCDDVDPEAYAQAANDYEVELARGFRPPFRNPGTQRNWRRAGIREDARPRMTFHFRYRYGFLPAFPRLEGKLVRHHLLPQARDLAEWFRSKGIDIHEWTVLIPEHHHLRIHRGPRGGLWNEAWRQFRDANRDREVTREELLAKAFELAFRYEITGPIVPYRVPILPPGPQLRAP